MTGACENCGGPCGSIAFAVMANSATHPACSRGCLDGVVARVSVTPCVREACRGNAPVAHLYCGPQCKEEDTRYVVGARHIMLTSGGAATLARAEKRLALVPGDAW